MLCGFTPEVLDVMCGLLCWLFACFVSLYCIPYLGFAVRFGFFVDDFVWWWVDIVGGQCG